MAYRQANNIPLHCFIGADVFNSGLRSFGFILKVLGNGSHDHTTCYEPYTRLGPRSRMMSKRIGGCGSVSCSRLCPQLARPWVRASLPPCLGCKAEQSEGVSAVPKINSFDLLALEF